MVSWSHMLQRFFSNFNMRYPKSPAVTVNIDQINYSLLWLMKKTKMTYPWLWCRGRLHPVHISLKYQGLLNSHNYVLPLIRSLYIDGTSMCYQYLSDMQKYMLEFWKSKKICIALNKLAITNYSVWNKIPLFEVWLIAWSPGLYLGNIRHISTLKKCDLDLIVEIVGMSNNIFFDYKFLK